MARLPYDSKQYYLGVWKGMLGTILGWSEEQIVAWAQTGEKWAAMDDPNHIFFHETPMYWAQHLLIPDSLKARLPHELLLRLGGDLGEVFTDEAKNWHSDPEEIDWLPYKERVDQLLARYAGSFRDGREASLPD